MHLTETWLKDTILKNEIFPLINTILRSGRKEIKDREGVLGDSTNLAINMNLVSSAKHLWISVEVI